jgi:hypothetical protein
VDTVIEQNGIRVVQEDEFIEELAQELDEKVYFMPLRNNGNAFSY